MSLNPIDFGDNYFDINVFENGIKKILFRNKKSLIGMMSENSVDKKKKEFWISKFHENDRIVARYLINNLQYISWETFSATLYSIISQAISKIGDNEYALFVSVNKKKSDVFLTALAYDYLYYDMRKNLAHSSSNITTLIDNYKHIMMIDDMSYSGSQLNGTVKYILDSRVPKPVRYNYDLGNEINGVFVTDITSVSEHNRMDFFVQLQIKNKGIKKGTLYYVFLKDKDGYHFYYKYRRIKKKGFEFNQIIVYNNLDFIKIISIIKQFSKFDELAPPGNYPKEYLEVPKISPLIVHLCVPYMSTEAMIKINKLKELGKVINTNFLIYSRRIKTSFAKLHNDYPLQPFNKNRNKETIDDEQRILREMILMYFVNISNIIMPGKALSICEIPFDDEILLRLNSIPNVPVFLNHKLASPVSTMPYILGCGIVLSPTSIRIDCDNGDTDKDIVSVGPLLKSCNNREGMIKFKDEIDEYKRQLFSYTRGTKYDQDIHEDVCLYCHKPVYKL